MPGIEQPVENFNWLNRAKGSRQSFCKVCKSQYNRFYEARSRGKTVGELRPQRGHGATLERDELGRKQCIACQEFLAESCFSKDQKILDGFTSACTRCRADAPKGLTIDRRRQLLEEQRGMCAIEGCGFVFDLYGGHAGTYRIDHDHACCPGQKTCGTCTRGLVCGKHNVKMSTIDEMRAILAYMEKYEQRKNAPTEVEAFLRSAG